MASLFFLLTCGLHLLHFSSWRVDCYNLASWSPILFLLLSSYYQWFISSSGLSYCSSKLFVQFLNVGTVILEVTIHVTKGQTAECKLFTVFTFLIIHQVMEWLPPETLRQENSCLNMLADTSVAQKEILSSKSTLMKMQHFYIFTPCRIRHSGKNSLMHVIIR